jgi:pyruvate,water dikinase
MAWVEEHPGPDRYGPPDQDPPDMSVLPLPARRVNAALIWAMGQEFAGADSGGDAVRGVPASDGVHTGAVRVVRTDDDFYDIEDGEVLVCRVASTSWSALLGLAGAIVCDGGGALSHTAIIARELGIPAVLGTGNATRVLQTGQLVTVDGSAGTVEVVDDSVGAGAGRTGQPGSG